MVGSSEILCRSICLSIKRSQKKRICVQHSNLSGTYHIFIYIYECVCGHKEPQILEKAATVARWPRGIDRKTKFYEKILFVYTAIQCIN